MMRSLPWSDRTVDRLPKSTRRRVAHLWSERATSEARVGIAFAALGRDLAAVGASPRVLALARRAATDETRHASLCLRLAARYGGAPPPLQDSRPPPRLPFARARLRTRVALRCTSLACISETIACAWLGACAELASSPLARAANRVHLGDEIGHARLGWAFLASPQVGPQERAAVARHLPALVFEGVAAWLAAACVLPTRGVPAHGIPSRVLHRRWVREATRDLVLPGFGAVGIDPAPAARTCEALWIDDTSR